MPRLEENCMLKLCRSMLEKGWEHRRPVAEGRPLIVDPSESCGRKPRGNTSAVRNHLQLKVSGVDKERNWSGREDSNLRPPGPEPGALARLSHAPCFTSLAALFRLRRILFGPLQFLG